MLVPALNLTFISGYFAADFSNGSNKQFNKMRSSMGFYNTNEVTTLIVNNVSAVRPIRTARRVVFIRPF